jgi:phage terminase large subunit-like protein
VKPFTTEHFDKWARGLRLDNEEPWIPEGWFLEFVEDVFAGFPICWLLVPEGNTKTTSMSGLALYHCEFRPMAFAPWAASARDQAEIGYTQAKVFAESMPDSRRPRCYDGYRRILFPNGSRIQVFAAGAEHADGVIPTLPLIDEAHRHRNMSLYRTWVGKLAKRGGQLGLFSTAGEPGSEFEDAREKIKVAASDVKEEGAFGRYATERVVLHEYAVRDPAGADDIVQVASANPFSKITVETLTEKRNDPTMTDAHWRRFTCNIATQTAHEPYLTAQEWTALGGGEEVPARAIVALGGDGSRTWDTTVIAWASVVAAGRIDVDARVFSVREDVPHHVLHAGGKIDFDDVEAFVIDQFDRFSVREAAYDPRYLERSMEIVERRLPEARIAAVEPSSKHMRDALQVFYSLAVEGKLRHRSDPVLLAHVANTRAERGYSGEIRRVAKIDPRLPIDAVPAMALAVWRASRAKPSVYRERQAIAV